MAFSPSLRRMAALGKVVLAAQVSLIHILFWTPGAIKRHKNEEPVGRALRN